MIIFNDINILNYYGKNNYSFYKKSNNLFYINNIYNLNSGTINKNIFYKGKQLIKNSEIFLSKYFLFNNLYFNEQFEIPKNNISFKITNFYCSNYIFNISSGKCTFYYNDFKSLIATSAELTNNFNLFTNLGTGFHVDGVINKLSNKRKCYCFSEIGYVPKTSSFDINIDRQYEVDITSDYLFLVLTISKKFKSSQHSSFYWWTYVCFKSNSFSYSCLLDMDKQEKQLFLIQNKKKIIVIDPNCEQDENQMEIKITYSIPNIKGNW